MTFVFRFPTINGRDMWLYNKNHVPGFFDTDLHEASRHFATHEAVRPSGL